jgi:uncharacterized membrane protein
MNDEGTLQDNRAEAVPYKGVPFNATPPLELQPRLAYGFVYGIQSLDLIKVGVAKDVKSRLFQIRGHNPHGCELVFKRSTVAPYVCEDKIHELLSEHSVGREWFRVTLEQVRGAAKVAIIHARRTWRAACDQYNRERNAELCERLRVAKIVGADVDRAMLEIRAAEIAANTADLERYKAERV